MSDQTASNFKLSLAKRALLKILQEEQGIGLPVNRPITPHVSGKPVPVTHGQAGLWFLSEMEMAGAAYCVPLVYHIFGKLNVEQLIKSLNAIICRHEILHTHFEEIYGEINQVVYPPFTLELPLHDVRHLPKAERVISINQFMLDDIHRGFNLSRDPLMRGFLFQEEEEGYFLYLVFHHIILDEWSLEKFLQELRADYCAGIEGGVAQLPKLPIQYGDYASWWSERLADGRYDSQLEYWKEKLDGAEYILELPLDYPRPSVISYRGMTITHELTGSILDSLKRLSHEEHVTLFTVLLSTFFLLLSKYSRRQDILIGTPVANRSRYEVQDLVGFFLNTLAIRGVIKNKVLFPDFLQQIHSTFLEAMSNQDFPFEKLVEALNPHRDLGRHPLNQVLFVLQNQAAFRLELPETKIELVNMDFGWSKFDLSLFAFEREGGLEIRAEFRTDLFKPETIDRMLRHYEVLLQEVLNNRHQEINHFSMLTTSERELLQNWNSTSRDYLNSVGVHQLVENQVNITPDATAVIFEHHRLTYRELNQQANRLANYLRDKGIKRGSIVGIFLGRSVEMMISVLGVIKAGGTILPLDPSYPKYRLEFMVTDAKASAVISQPSLAPQLEGIQVEVISLPVEKTKLVQYSEENPALPTHPEDLLYLLYTSGSTGQPKGVMMPHRPLVNLICWQIEQDKAASSLRTIQYTSLSFDVSFQEIFTTWCSGGTLVLVNEENRKDFDRFFEYLVEHKIERLFLPFVALQLLAETANQKSPLPINLEEVITAGEQLQITPEIENFFTHLAGCRLYNHYGPTEAHVVSTYLLEGSPSRWPRLPPIGKPIANTQIYLMDPFFQPVAIGLEGEIFLGGGCLAQGYLNQPELTTERFILNPLDGGKTRLYRTGDLGCYLQDGNIQYLGRIDQQVKIRGFRVEPGEIEILLSENPLIRQAVVLARQAGVGDTRLEAYIKPEPEAKFEVEKLREELKSRLPDFMLPSVYYVRDEFPLTPSGKIDRRALQSAPPSGVIIAEPEGGGSPPRDDLERQLCQIWGEVLNTYPIGINENFFNKGGHSLLAVRLFTQIEQRIGVRLPVSSLFQAPTIVQLARLIRDGYTQFGWSPLVPMQTQGSKPPFFCIHNFGGFVINYEPLAQALGDDQPFFGLQARGLDGFSEPQTTISEMAHSYLQAIQEKQPTGPYFLGGYCFGGVVAYEISRLLLDRGERVGLLALIDAYAPTHEQRKKPGRWERLMAMSKNLPYWLRDFRQLDADERRVVVMRRIKRAMISLQNRIGQQAAMTPRELIGDHADVKAAPDHLQRLMEMHMLALMKYSPPIYDGRVTLFRIQRLPLFTHYEPDVGWGQLATGGVDFHIIPGAHHNVLAPPYVQGLAKELSNCLERAYKEAD